MQSEQRDRLWSRNATSLRVMSGWVGVVGVLVGLGLIGVSCYVAAQVDSGWPIVSGILHAMAVWVMALFVMALGRTVATIAEIQWFASNASED